MSVNNGRHLRYVVCLGSFLTLSVMSAAAWGIDPLSAGKSVSTTAAAAMLVNDHAQICVFGQLANPLPLQEAVERSLCSNPTTREAWAQVKIASAAMGVSRAAYLPNVSANWQGVRDDTVTNVTGFPQFSSDYKTSVLRTDSVSLSWVLYDFGGRKAALANATALLAAAQASQQAALETTFAGVAKDYYSAQAAQGALVAAREIEQTANDSFRAATMRVDKGIAPISDELQAQTSWAEAIVNRTQAEGDWQTALGTLASALDLPPNIPLTLPDVGDGVSPGNEFDESVADLIDAAKRSHPSVLAAQAQLDAAVAKVSQTRAEELPSLNLVAKYSENNNPTTLQLGFPQLPTTGHDWYVGFQLTIPIFSGFGQTYQIHRAEAQVELQRDTLDEVRQQVGLDVWTSYQTLETATHNLGNSATLLDLAQRSYNVAQRRYQVGVGNILDLLNAQSSLADAKRKRIAALTDWRSARLQLAAKLGRLGMWDIAPDASSELN